MISSVPVSTDASSVSTRLGCTEFTRMPSSPSSSAATLVSMSTPALLAQYAAMNRCVTWPASDEIVAIVAAARAADRDAGMLHGEEHAREVGRKHRVPVVEGHAHQRRRCTRSRRRHRDVQASERLGRASDRLLDARLVGDVARHPLDEALALLLEVGDCLAQAILTSGCDRHRGAIAYQVTRATRARCQWRRP